ncbi:MAG: ABC transporter permease [Kiloniellales bacterium]|nr:ABC transporter permease [Kiloniellales bacterium]
MTILSSSATPVPKPPITVPLRARIGFAVLVTLVVASLAAPVIAPFEEARILSHESFGFPAEAGPLGTDHLGRDLLSRLLYGGRFTLLLALVTSSLAFLIGVGAGFAAALIGGLADDVISRTVDGLLSFPSIVLALLAINALGTSIVVLIGAVALIEGCRVFRLARPLARDVSVLEFVDAARARGEGLFWIAVREVLPNTTGPLSAEFGLRFTYVILFISALSFIGLGVQPPTADWGVMVRENAKGLIYGSPAALLPAVCIALVTISVNLIVDAFVDHDREARVPEMLP